MVINSNHERYEDLLLIRDKITCREREREREGKGWGGDWGGRESLVGGNQAGSIVIDIS